VAHILTRFERFTFTSLRLCRRYFDCLIHRDNIKEYFESINFWPITDCLLANWWPEAETTPKLDYGELELPANDSATLYQALKILGDDYSHEEFALILLDGDIVAFEKRNETNTLRPITNIKAWLNAHFRAEAFSGEPRHVDLILEQFRYSKPGLSDFKFRALPDHRYMSFTQACGRVTEFKGSIEAAETKLTHALDYGEIQANHPLGGRITPEQSGNGMFWKRCYFQKWRLAKWITTEFGEASISDIKNQVDAMVLSQIFRRAEPSLIGGQN